MGVGAGDDDVARLDRLAQGFEDGARILGELVHEEDAVVRQADLARLGALAAADDRRHGRRVVRLAERPVARDAAFVEQSAQRVDHRGFERLGGAEGGQDARQARGQHRLARPRRADHEEVVPPRRRDLERALGAFLPLHVAQVAHGRVVAHLAR